MVQTTTTQPEFHSVDDVLAQRDKMKAFFDTGQTLSIDFRRQKLIELKAHLKASEERILGALQEDLGKAPFEGYVTELGLVYDEINLMLKKLNCWTRPQWKGTPLVHFPATSKVYPSPHGVVLVLSPWNYPIQLALVPLVDAIAAGNCVGLKPSRTSVNTGKLIVELLSEVFPPEYICGFPGSGDMNNWLLEPHWDLVFFTGSPSVGKEIMTAAAKHLTPVVLELGGKSPCFVDRSANLLRAGQRIAWGKGINAGQTCVAPDYLLVHKDAVPELTVQLELHFRQYYGTDIVHCDWWPHIISDKHYERIMGLIENVNPNAKVVFGGHGDPETRKIEPTCITGITLDDPIMKEEIFGPVLPVITYETLDEAFEIVRTIPTPLATYIFADDKTVQQRIINELQFGGATINDVVIHEANNHMGFGGFGNSGMGSYHGKAGFDTFTHYKSTMKKYNFMELDIRYPPFGDKLKLARMLMK